MDFQLQEICKWLQNLPGLVTALEVDCSYESSSMLLVTRLPHELWVLMPHREAYNAIGNVCGGNAATEAGEASIFPSSAARRSVSPGSSDDDLTLAGALADEISDDRMTGGEPPAETSSKAA